MATGNRIIRIKAQPHVPGGRFCRAGLCFGTVCTTLDADELTAEQLAALQAEPMLVVEIVEEVKPTAPQAKAEAKAKEEAPADPPKDAEPSAAAPAPDAKAKASDAKPADKKGGK